jgi:hypothetical protein
MTRTQALDPDKAEAFGERMVGAVNNASLVVMTSLGHRTGLIDAMAQLAPSSSATIAQAAELEERYVREWLGAMVTGGFDPVQVRRIEGDVFNNYYVAQRS